MLINRTPSCTASICGFNNIYRYISFKNASSTTQYPYDVNSNKYQFLQESILPTYHFQKSLRRLPIPKLEKSCERFLSAVEAIYTENETKQMKSLIDEFMNSDGYVLHKALKDYDRHHQLTSYISEPWFDMYLSARTPCPVNSNPFMMFAPDSDPLYNNQLIRATNFVISCGRFKRSLDAEILEPEIFYLNPLNKNKDIIYKFWSKFPERIAWYAAAAFKAFPLDMSQYKSLFGGCRIPQREKDKLNLNINSRHFIVSRKGTFYSVDLFDSKGQLNSPDYIYSTLNKILNINSTNENDEESFVGSLTTMDRDNWADIRQELINFNSQNFLNLKLIEDGLFLLCLDDLGSTEPTRLVKSLLCGDDGKNRWFDKCFQLIVDGNGQTTINFEHSWGDGVAVLRLMEEILKDTISNRFVNIDKKIDSSKAGEIKKLDWKLNNSLKTKIRQASEDHVKRCNDLGFDFIEHKNLTKEEIKKAKLSPDAIMQLAMQLAYYSIYNEFVPTYESCSTAAFLKGRTECMRSATKETREAVLAFNKGTSTKQELIELIKKCSNKHSELVKEASLGHGFDRHFFGLKYTAEHRLNRSIQNHYLFNNPIYINIMNNFILSTSTLSTDTIYFGGFGPSVKNGLGIGYNVTNNKLGAAVTCYKSQNRNATEFCKALDDGLNKIKSTIEGISE